MHRMMHSQGYQTVYLLLLMSLGYVATDIYLPSLPAISKYFQVGDNEVQRTLFSYLLSFSFAPLLFGPISDHIGRKKVLLGGVLASIFATFGCLYAGNIEWFIGFRFLQGIGLGAVLISARTAVTDLFTGKALEKQISLTAMMMPIFLAVAPTIGGLLQEKFQWQAVFVFLICYLFLIFILILLTPESLKKFSHEKISQVFSKYQTHLHNSLFLVYGINFFLPSIGIFSYLTVSPFLFQEILGLSPAEYGALAIYIGATIILTGYLNIRLIHRFSLVQIICLGSVLIILSGGLLLFFQMTNLLTTWTLLIPCLIYFTSVPLCVANSASKSLSLIKENFGAANALLSTFQFLAGALASYIFSLLPNETALSLAICFLIIGALSLINLKFARTLENKLKTGIKL